MTEKLSPQDRLFVLTGAGVSAESGLPTFRGLNGLWRGYRVEDVATPEAFAADPAMVWQFYSERRQRHQTVQPNPAHFALADVERALKDRFFLCTQNVDSLHEQAGSQRVVHMHGRLMQSRCSRPLCRTAPFDDCNLYRTRQEIPHCRGVWRDGASAHLLVRRSAVSNGTDTSAIGWCDCAAYSGHFGCGRTCCQLREDGTPQPCAYDLRRSRRAVE